MWHRFSPALRRAVLSAERAARRPTDSLSTGHLLHGLLAAGDGAAYTLLDRAGFPAPPDDLPGEGDGPRDGITAPARAAVERAYDEAAELGDSTVGTEHLLLGLLRTTGCAAERAFSAHGITAATIGTDLLRIRPQRHRAPEGATDPQPWRRRALSLRRTALERVAVPVLTAGYAATQAKRDPLVALLALAQTGGLGGGTAHYRRLHELGVHRSRGGGGWVIARYEDAARALKEPALSAQRFEAGGGPLPDRIEREFNGLCGGMSRMMLFQDAPEQARLRARLSRRFTPRVIESMRAQIVATTAALLDAVEARGGTRMDVIADLAFPLPATVIARLLGVCEDDLTRFKEWSDDFVRFIRGDGDLADDLRTHRSLAELTAYFRRAMAEVTAAPDDTLLLLLVHSEDEEGRLSGDEVLANCLLLLAAGHETTTHLIGNGLLLLLRHPEQMRRLCAEPSLLPGAVEEMLRRESVVQWTSRIALRDIDWGDGITIGAGEFVYVGLGAANRDPSRFPEPERFDVARENAGRHLAFGFGPHFCLGAALARMEAETALGALLSRFPDLSPGWAPWSPPRRRRDFTFRALESLPVRLGR